MAYSNLTKAEDVLGSSTLKISLPASALELPCVRELLGVPADKAARAVKEASSGPARRSAQREAGQEETAAVAVVTVGEVGWDWETDTMEYYDEEGSQDTLERRLDYSIDSGDVNGLSHIHYRLSQALRVMGIPFDCEFFNSIDGTTDLARGRMSKERLGDYCLDKPVNEKPSFEDTLNMAKTCSSLADFTEWLECHADDCAPLARDAAKFDRLLAEPGRLDFLVATASIHWMCARPGRRWGMDVDVEWTESVRGWIRQEWEGEDPLARFARCGMPIGMPKLEQFMTLALAQAEPDEKLAASAMAAYCSINAKPFGGVGFLAGKASVRAATVVGKCLAACPSLASELPAKARAFFDLDLADREPRESESDYALAEAHWLRAQSVMARKEATLAPTLKTRSL